jgi:DNA-binding transcriptional MocR family regulator
MKIELNRDDGPPLGEQIADGLAKLITGGELLAGARLPSVRQLALRLEVSAFTVIAGYDRLCARNLIASRPGAGYFVVGPSTLREASFEETLGADPTEAIGFALQSLDTGGAALRAGSGFLPESWLTDVVPTSLVTRVAKAGNALLSPSPAQGSIALRRQLSDWLRTFGIVAMPNRIVTTIGASQAIDLLLRALLRPGDSVMVEDPGYVFFSAQARAMDLNLVPVRRLPDGPDMDALEAALEQHRPKLFITQTLLHNPTGGTTSAAKCHRLLLLAERYGLSIIEDDVYGDLAPKGAMRLAQLDELQRVYYVSSFSKVLSPALRVGFVALPAAALDGVVGQKVLSTLASPAITEAIVEAVLASGRYHRHVQHVRTKLAKFRQGAMAMLSDAGVVLEPAMADGLFLWGRIPGMADPDAVVRKALDAGILLAKGRLFSPSGRFEDYLRFNVANSCDARLAGFLRNESANQAVDSNVRSIRPRRLSGDSSR